MEKTSRLIINLYTDTFSLIKVKRDLFYYLNENPNNFFKKSGNDFSLNIINVDTTQYEKILIREEDEIHILSFFSVYSVNGDFYFNVEIAIGKYIEDSVNFSFFNVEKCLAKLKYNYDLSLYDIEFYINEINKQN